MDLEILKLRNILAIVAAGAVEYTLSTLGGVKPFETTDSLKAFLALLVAFLILFWVIERLYKWMARR